MCLCGLVGALLVASPAFAQSSDIQARIKRIENDVDTLNRAVYKGQTPPPLSQEANESKAVLDSRLSQIENDLRELTGKVEQQSYDNQQLQQKLEALEGQFRNISAGSVASGQSQQATAPVGSDTVVIDGTPSVLQPDASVEVNSSSAGGMDAASLYEQGFAQIKQSDYPAAEKTFAAFIKDYPTHALAPNALYWLGETYYVRKDYDKASRIFAESYQKYPGGPKAADNLLKLGMSLAGKGEKDSACVALKQLKKEYPQGPGPVLTRADQEMSTLGCP